MRDLQCTIMRRCRRLPKESAFSISSSVDARPKFQLQDGGRRLRVFHVKHCRSTGVAPTS